MAKFDIDESRKMVRGIEDIETLVNMYRQQRSVVQKRIKRAEEEGFGDNYAVINAKVAVELTPSDLLNRAKGKNVTDSRIVIRLQNAVIDVMEKGSHELLYKKGRSAFRLKLVNTLNNEYGNRQITTPKQLAVFTSIMEKMRREKIDEAYASSFIAEYAHRAATARNAREWVEAFDNWAKNRKYKNTDFDDNKHTINVETIRRWGYKRK